MSAARQYDVVVFGATGYTGKLIAEYIVKHLPTNLKWALVGRSESKLEAVAAVCKTLSPDRIQPSIDIVNLNDADLDALAKKTTVLIAAVGPYALYGEYAFKACAENGTHYLDVTGEVPWVADMINKYEKIAKASGSMMFPQIGVESAPADLITWSLVNMNRERFSAPSKEVVVSIHELNSKPSGGTLNTVLSILDIYKIEQLKKAFTPYALSPIPGPKTSNPNSWFTKLFGIRVVPDLGILTTSLAGSTDSPVIQRSWGLLGGNDFYGPNFQFSEYMKARNHLGGIFWHFALAFGMLCLSIPVFRTVARRYVYQPGDGPKIGDTRSDVVEYRGITAPDIDSPSPPRAFCRARFSGSLYALTALIAAEGAISILKDDHNLPGGIYTPASLKQKYIDRVHGAGFKFEAKFFEN